MKPLKICRICEQFPPLKGGLSSGMLDLSMAQHEKGHDVTVITRSCSGDLKFDSYIPFKVIRIPSQRLFAFGWKAFTQIKRFSPKPDIVHSHGPSAFAYLLRRERRDPPVVHTMHAVRRYQFELFQELPEMVREFESRLGARVFRKPKYYKKLSLRARKELFLEKYICQRADHIVVVAEYFADQIREYYDVPYNEISVAYNGTKFDPDKVYSADISSLKSLRINGDKDIILYVGRTDWVKRVHLLVEAMPALMVEFPHACLIIAGTGDQTSDLTRLVTKLGLDGSVKLLGWVPHETLPALLKLAKCFCLPSYWEGLSKSLLEAMSVKIPVIATDNLSNREVLRGGKLGWLVRHPTSEAWSEMMKKVLSGGREVQEKADIASRLIDKIYRWHDVAHRVDAAYQKLLA